MSPTAALLALALPLASPPGPAAFTPETAPDALKPAVAKADASAKALQVKLSTRLREAMKQGGPAAAVAVCRDEAARLTEEAARESKVSVGRTSDRLRSRRNASPAWAAPYVAAAAGKKADQVQPAVIDLGDKVGVLRPIAFATACATCHGPKEGLEPAIAKTLAAAYPEDRATGYAEGDHRGFVWAVVSK